MQHVVVGGAAQSRRGGVRVGEEIEDSDDVSTHARASSASRALQRDQQQRTLS